jgi:hypothetical protein
MVTEDSSSSPLPRSSYPFRPFMMCHRMPSYENYLQYYNHIIIK